MLKILLVDDDSDELELFENAFQSLNQPVLIIQATDCGDLFGCISLHKPDLVFLDINMPGMNGIECLIQVREEAQFEDLPIIMYSTSNNTKHIEASYEHKANLYIVKPSSY